MEKEKEEKLIRKRVKHILAENITPIGPFEIDDIPIVILKRFIFYHEKDEDERKKMYCDRSRLRQFGLIPKKKLRTEEEKKEIRKRYRGLKMKKANRNTKYFK